MRLATWTSSSESTHCGCGVSADRSQSSSAGDDTVAVGSLEVRASASGGQDSGGRFQNLCLRLGCLAVTPVPGLDDQRYEKEKGHKREGQGLIRETEDEDQGH